jgi:hypothetical protein
VVSPRPWDDMSRVRHGGSFQFRIATEQLGLKSHETILL